MTNLAVCVYKIIAFDSSKAITLILLQGLLNRYIHDLLLGEVGLAEVVFEVGHLHDVLVGAGLVLELAALEAEEAVGVAVALLLGDVFTAYLEQVFEGHHGTAHREVEEVLLLLATAVTEGHVLESDALRHLGGYAYLLADAVDKVKVYLGEHDGQRNAGEAASCADIEHPAAGGEAYHLGNAQ